MYPIAFKTTTFVILYYCFVILKVSEENGNQTTSLHFWQNIPKAKPLDFLCTLIGYHQQKKKTNNKKEEKEEKTKSE